VPDISNLITRSVPVELRYREDLYGDTFIVHFKYRPEIIDADFMEQMSARAGEANATGLTDDERKAMSPAALAQFEAAQSRKMFEANMKLVSQLISEWDLTDNGVIIPIEAESVRQAKVPVALTSQMLLTVLESINSPKNVESLPNGSSTARGNAQSSTNTTAPRGSLVARQPLGT
jgi:hypothetical protein